MSQPTLYHYTCEHGREALGRGAMLLSSFDVFPEVRGLMPGWLSTLAWLTDLDQADRHGLGLTKNFTSCDRTAHRYRLTTGGAWVQHWPVYARALTREQRDSLEMSPGALPMHWWVALAPVWVAYDPLQPNDFGGEK